LYLIDILRRGGEGHEEAAEKGKAPPVHLGDANHKTAHILASAQTPGLKPLGQVPA